MSTLRILGLATLALLMLAPDAWAAGLLVAACAARRSEE